MKEGGPKMPETPSKTINKMLKEKCGKEHTNVVKMALSYYICGFFQVITTFYNAINPDSANDSHKLWMAACGVISSLVVLKAYLIYNIIMASAFVVHTLLYYGATAMALFGVGLGVSGAVFFDKEAKKSKRPVSPPPSPPSTSPLVVPQMVKSYESGKPPAETLSSQTEITSSSSGTHGSPEPQETPANEGEEKKEN